MRLNSKLANAIEIQKAFREKLMETVSSEFNGKLNILPTMELKAEDYASVMGTNLESTFHINQLAHPLPKASRFSSIILMSSVTGVVTVDVDSIYSKMKAMNQLDKNLACEWAKDNIRVNSVAPWFVQTPLTDKVITLSDTYLLLKD
ncbi:hypothetical protein RDABS01_023931 [Bienertia sinuspersici]